MHPLRILDRFLNGITMYRLTLYGLRVLAGGGIALAFLGVLSLSPWAMIVSLLLVVGACIGTNWILARVWRVASNRESSIITGLILFCILPPATSWPRAAALLVAALLAIASKYMVAAQRRHIFNPAAFAAVIVGLLGIVHATWWIGSRAMLPLTLIIGLLIARKLRRFSLVAACVGTGLLATVVVSTHVGMNVPHSVEQALVWSPLIFFATIMVTEPTTLPPRRWQGLLYGAFVGGLSASELHAGMLALTPEIALLIGNILVYAVSSRSNVRLRLVQKTQLAPYIYDFAFAPDRPYSFLPGQYAAFTLPVARRDDRGNRRTFTLASSPTEKLIRIGVKFPEPSSAFKQTLLQLKPGDPVDAAQISGDFVLPSDPKRKLVFIAGGVGITPFCSMLQYLIDTKQHRDIILFYIVSDPKEVVYTDLLASAKRHGVRIVTVLSPADKNTNWNGRRGHLTKEVLAAGVPDYHERAFYLSGPNAMVDAYRTVLRRMGVARRRIVTDHFSGY